MILKASSESIWKIISGSAGLPQADQYPRRRCVRASPKEIDPCHHLQTESGEQGTGEAGEAGDSHLFGPMVETPSGIPIILQTLQ